MNDNYYMKKTKKICPSCLLHTGDIPPEAIKLCLTHENKDKKRIRNLINAQDDTGEIVYQKPPQKEEPRLTDIPQKSINKYIPAYIMTAAAFITTYIFIFLR